MFNKKNIFVRAVCRETSRKCNSDSTYSLLYIEWTDDACFLPVQTGSPEENLFRSSASFRWCPSSQSTYFWTQSMFWVVSSLVLTDQPLQLLNDNSCCNSMTTSKPLKFPAFANPKSYNYFYLITLLTSQFLILIEFEFFN